MPPSECTPLLDPGNPNSAPRTAHNMAPNASQEHASTNGNDIENAQDGNSKPLAKTKNDSFFSRGFIFGPIDKKHCDLILLAHSVATGMVDAACFSNWGVFAGMQTGQNIFSHVLYLQLTSI